MAGVMTVCVSWMIGTVACKLHVKLKSNTYLCLRQHLFEIIYVDNHGEMWLAKSSSVSQTF